MVISNNRVQATHKSGTGSVFLTPLGAPFLRSPEPNRFINYSLSTNLEQS